MKPALLALFAFHFHMPPGAPDPPAERLFDSALAPLLALAEARPHFRPTLHLSGSLLDRAERLRPELVDRLAALVAAGRAEILGGGYHDPLLPLLPDADRLLQLDRMSDRVERRFGVRPAGAWLAERAWDPALCPALHAAGIEYTILDDGHFRPLGLPPERLRGVFVAEEAGCPLRLLPGSQRLRYAMPFRPVEEAAEVFETVARETSGGALLAADDGDKFGAWPGTEFAAGRGGWLDRFLERALAVPGVRSATCLEAVRTLRPLGRAEPPAGSYPEFLEWSLPADAGRELRRLSAEAVARGDSDRLFRFLSAGSVRNFLAKYPEADLLHKKALRVSALVFAMRKSPRRAKAEAALLAAQAGDVYWHGVFPGIYDPALRAAAWEALVTAEALSLADGRPFVAAAEEDVDADGLAELSLESDRLLLLAKPDLGGALLEFDHRPTRGNLLDAMTRRPEAYHRPGGEDGPYDWHRRAGFVDRFLHADLDPGAFAAGAARELGDFTLAPFRYGVRRSRGRVEATLERTGRVETPGGLAPVTLQKRIVMLPGDDGVAFEWSVRNDSMERLDLLYGVEWNLAAPGPGGYVACDGGPADPELGRAERRGGVRLARLADPARGRAFDLSADSPFDLVRHAVVTRHRDLAGPAAALQGVCLVACHRVRLDPAGVLRVRGRAAVARLGEAS